MTVSLSEWLWLTICVLRGLITTSDDDKVGLSWKKNVGSYSTIESCCFVMVSAWNSLGPSDSRTATRVYVAAMNDFLVALNRGAALHARQSSANWTDSDASASAAAPSCLGGTFKRPYHWVANVCTGTHLDLIRHDTASLN